MIALIKHTGNYKTVSEEVETEKGLETVERQEEILETVKTYAEDKKKSPVKGDGKLTTKAPPHASLLYRAKLTAELKTRETGIKHKVKVVE